MNPEQALERGQGGVPASADLNIPCSALQFLKAFHTHYFPGSLQG